MSLGRLLALTLLVLTSCSSRDTDKRTAIRVRWAFANGQECNDNQVVNVRVRGHVAGADNLISDGACPDGHLDFPTAPDKIEEGAWAMEVQAFDASSRTCFETVLGTVTVANNETASMLAIFHKLEDAPLCTTVSDDVDGGVTFDAGPEPDAGGGEGEGEGEGEDAGFECPREPYRDGACPDGYSPCALGPDEFTCFLTEQCLGCCDGKCL